MISGCAGPVLRQASVDDVAALRQIRRDAIVVLAAPALGMEAALRWADSADVDRERRAVEEHMVTVAEIGQAPVGWVERLDDRIHGLYVTPDHAGRGVGHLLMQHAEDQIGSTGSKAVFLHSSRNAEGFYRARGFTAVGPASVDKGLPMVKALG